MRYAVIGEDESDVDVVKSIIENLNRTEKKPDVKTKGYSGCGEMLRKGARQLQLFEREDCHRFVVCYDSDRDNPEARVRKILSDVIRPSKVARPMCALVPIQEIEAWILADLAAVTNVIKSWVPTENFPSPENIDDPKERLEKLSRNERRRPLYVHALHNSQVAKYLNYELVYKKCPSFRPLAELIRNGVGNVKDGKLVALP